MTPDRVQRNGVPAAVPRKDADNRLLATLSSRILPPIVVIGVGSELRGDDAFGLEVVRMLSSAGVPDGVQILEGGVAPENLAERVARGAPRTVLVVDAADFGGSAGDLRLIKPGDLSWQSVGTHAPSLELLAHYLAERSQAATFLLACQPASTELGERMSDTVREAATRASGLVREAMHLNV